MIDMFDMSGDTLDLPFDLHEFSLNAQQSRIRAKYTHLGPQIPNLCASQSQSFLRLFRDICRRRNLLVRLTLAFIHTCLQHLCLSSPSPPWP